MMADESRVKERIHIVILKYLFEYFYSIKYNIFIKVFTHFLRISYEPTYLGIRER